MRVSVVGGGVTVQAGQDSAPVIVNTLSPGAVPVTLSASLGNQVAAGVRVEQAQNETGNAAEADFCNIQFPGGFAADAGEPTLLIFGRLFELMTTEAPGAPPGWVAQVGYGPQNSDPRLLTEWYFFDTTYNLQVMNDDEFQCNFIAPELAGPYSFVYRFSPDGARWTYCDTDGAGSNDMQDFSTAQLGFMSVVATFDELVINEVDYDNVGTDTLEFVEVFNGSPNTLSLANLALIFVNGADNTEYRRVALDGAGPSIGPGEYFVVGTGNVTMALPPEVARITFPLAMDNVQNGAPDGVALFNTATDTLLDALSYEGQITMATFGVDAGVYNLVEGTPLAAADSSMVQGSLSRRPNGTDTDDANVDWVFSSTPTPGTANVE
jgi:hypothetical protein